MSHLRTAISSFSIALLLATGASAHIVAAPNKGENGAWFKTSLMVGHGCDGEDTKEIVLTVPKELLIIKPQMKPGWTIDIQKETLAKPVQGPHGPITEITKTISWRGNLPDAWFDEFGLSMKLPDNGKTIVLPVLQKCTKSSRNWNEVPMQGGHAHGMHHDTESPAPVITLTPAAVK